MLFDCRAQYLEPPDPLGDAPPIRITLPDGATARSDDHDVNDALSSALGRAVRLETRAPAAVIIEEYYPDVEGVAAERRDRVIEGQIALLAPPGTYFDAAPVHVLTTSTLAALAAAYPRGTFDVRRFRPNVLIDTSSTGADDFVENLWVDHSLRIGAEVALHVVLSVPRCVMTTLPQSDLPPDKGILQTIARENRFEIPGLGPSSCAGVYGLVSAGGAVSVGDGISLGPV
jgi:uncharacterized protein YcbX